MSRGRQGAQPPLTLPTNYRTMDTKTYEAAQRLAEARKTLQDAIEVVATMRHGFDELAKPFINKIRAAQAIVDSEEEALRERAEEAFATTGDKTPAPGVQIKMYEKLTYSASEALAWATEHDIAIVPARLDVKTFEKVAKTTKPWFVTIEEKPQVTVAKDLTKALTDATQQAMNDKALADAGCL